MTSSEFPHLEKVVTDGINLGQHSAAQFAIWESGSNAPITANWGETWNGSSVTPSVLFPWLSSGKPLTAAAVLQQVERGSLDLEQPVAEILPEFAVGGKEQITIRNLLAHTGGFRLVDIGPLADAHATDMDGDTTWQRIIRRICAAKLESRWVPGQTAGYHPATSWFILGEIVQRTDGRPIAQYLREEIFVPLEMTTTFLSLQEAEETLSGTNTSFEKLKHTSKPDHPDHRLMVEAAVGYVSPGETLRSTAADMTRFYQMLLKGGELNDERVLTAESVAAMTSRQRVDARDKTFQSTMDWGLGTIINSRHYDQPPHPYGYGQWASPDSFGHSGNETSVAFADPIRGAAIALIFNGLAGATNHQKRMEAALDALYEDLGWTE
jgi:CubicO group peptidase (beta-lactamase class C family)